MLVLIYPILQQQSKLDLRSLFIQSNLYGKYRYFSYSIRLLPHTPHHTTQHHTTPIPHRTTPHRATSHHPTPRHTTPHHTVPHRVRLRSGPESIVDGEGHWPKLEKDLEAEGQHGPVDYVIEIHPPLIIENLLPHRGMFVIMRSGDNPGQGKETLWIDTLNHGDCVPIHTVRVRYGAGGGNGMGHRA